MDTSEVFELPIGGWKRSFIAAVIAAEISVFAFPKVLLSRKSPGSRKLGCEQGPPGDNPCGTCWRFKGRYFRDTDFGSEQVKIEFYALIRAENRLLSVPVFNAG